jgi:hypothetical protein
MLSQFEKLCKATEDRYASDIELNFLQEYANSFALRREVYGKLKAAETDLVRKVYEKIKATDPNLLLSNNADLSVKWKADTVRVLRYIAVAVLMDDTETFRQRFLLWFQTIMKAFGTEHSCYVTYEIMKQVLQQYLTPAQYQLVLPPLELTQTLLGKSE